MFLHFPGDPATASIDTQFMLGPDVLVAPVLHPCSLLPDAAAAAPSLGRNGSSVSGGGACAHRAYLPRGEWKPLEWVAFPSPGTDSVPDRAGAAAAAAAAAAASEGAWVSVDAPLGRPTVFLRAGSAEAARLQEAVSRAVGEWCRLGRSDGVQLLPLPFTCGGKASGRSLEREL